MPSLERTYRRVTRHLPPELAGRLDLRMPSYWGCWSGPLNGQARRREILRELARAIQFDRVLETGTYRGTTTEFFAAVFGAPVYTVERDPRHYAFSSRRLSVLADVHVELGDSREFLARLADEAWVKTETVFIYLDAHWQEDLPLAEELRIIPAAWSRCVVMVDDFQIPGDIGYQYDDYGPGQALVEEYLPASALEGWSLSYPSAPSGEETGFKRGCCVLASPTLAESAVPGLRLSRIL